MQLEMRGVNYDLDEVLKTRRLVHCDLYGNWTSPRTDEGKIAFDYERSKRWWLVASPPEWPTHSRAW